MDRLTEVTRKYEQIYDKLYNNKTMMAIHSITQNEAFLAHQTRMESIRRIYENSSLIAWQNQMNEMMGNLEIYKVAEKVSQMYIPVLDNYYKMTEFVNVAQQIADAWKPIELNVSCFDGLYATLGSVQQAIEINNRLIQEPKLLLNVQEAINSFDEDELKDFETSSEPVEYTQESVSEILDEINENIHDLSNTVKLLEEKSKPEKRKVFMLLNFILAEFFSGYLQYGFNPIYKMMTPTNLYQEESIESQMIFQIPENAVIQVIGDDCKEFIEINCTTPDGNFNGYVSKEDLNNNQLISNGVKLEHLSYITSLVELLSDDWKVDQEKVYAFIQIETSLINEFILPKYEELKNLDERTIIEVIEQYFMENEVLIPFPSQAEQEEMKSEVSIETVLK